MERNSHPNADVVILPQTGAGATYLMTLDDKAFLARGRGS